MKKPGSRVGAVLSADDEVVKLLGYGVYVGDEVPPKPMGLVASLSQASTWEEYDAVMLRDHLWAPAMGPVPHNSNPKIVLDDGAVVWGCECWWGTEEKVRDMLQGRRVVLVNIEEARAAAAALRPPADVAAAD